MALTREQRQIWQAMNVGVQWVLRDGVDPLAPEPKPAVVAVHASAEAAPAAVSPSATISAGSASAVPAMVRRGPMATRLRRQQAAVGIQTASPAASTFAKSAPITSAQPSVSLKPAVTPKVVARPALRPIMAPQPVSVQVQADAQLVAELRTARWEDIKAIADRCRVCPMASERTQHGGGRRSTGLSYRDGGRGAWARRRSFGHSFCRQQRQAFDRNSQGLFSGTRQGRCHL